MNTENYNTLQIGSAQPNSWLPWTFFPTPTTTSSLGGTTTNSYVFLSKSIHSSLMLLSTFLFWKSMESMSCPKGLLKPSKDLNKYPGLLLPKFVLSQHLNLNHKLLSKRKSNRWLPSLQTSNQRWRNKNQNPKLSSALARSEMRTKEDLKWS